MSARIFATFLAGAMAGGCTLSQQIPDDAQIQCERDGQCPQGWVCRLERCVQVGANKPPTVAIGDIQRSVTDVLIPVTVFDDEEDEVTLTVTFDDPTAAASGDAMGVTGNIVAATVGGTDATITWPAGQLATTPYREDSLVVLVTPSDASGTGEVGESRPFSYGNEPPALVLTPLLGPLTGAIGIEFALSDRASDLANVQVDFRLSASDPWTKARLRFDNTSNLVTNPTGLTHAVIWLSSSDYNTGDPNGEGIGVESLDTVQVRLIPSDAPGMVPSAGVPVVSAPFTVSNIVNLPPDVSIMSINGSAGIIDVVYFISDNENDGCTLEVEYQVGTSGWRRASGGPIGDRLAMPPVLLDSTPGSNQRTFSWDSLSGDAVARSVAAMVQLRLAAADPIRGIFVESAPFLVDNSGSNQTPSAIIEPIGGTQSGNVAIVYRLIDDESDALDIEVEVLSEELGTTMLSFKTAAEGTGGDGTMSLSSSSNPGNAHTFVWDSVIGDTVNMTGVGISRRTDVVVAIRPVQLTPADNAAPFVFSNPFTVDNGAALNAAPSVSMRELPAAVGPGSLPVLYEVSDREGDAANIIAEYSTDDGSNWLRASSHPVMGDPVVAVPTSSAGEHRVFLWHLEADTFGFGSSASAMLRLTATDSYGSSPPVTSLPMGVTKGMAQPARITSRLGGKGLALATSASGIVHAAWNDAAASQVHHASFDGMLWQEDPSPLMVPAEMFRGAVSNDVLHLLWFFPPNIRTATYNGGWGAPSTVSSTAGGLPAIVAEPGGPLWAAWFDNGALELFSNNGGGWVQAAPSPANMNVAGGERSGLWAAGDGFVHMTWWGIGVHYTRYNGSMWEATTTLAPQAFPIEPKLPTVAADGKGAVYVAWFEQPDPSSPAGTIRYAISADDGGNFGSAQDLTSANEQSMALGQLDMVADASGTFYLTWLDDLQIGTSQSDSLMLSVASYYGPFTPPARALAGIEPEWEAAQLQLDPSGFPYLLATQMPASGTGGPVLRVPVGRASAQLSPALGKGSATQIAIADGPGQQLAMAGIHLADAMTMTWEPFLVSSTDSGATWRDPIMPATVAEWGGAAVAFDAAGDMHMVWAQDGVQYTPTTTGGMMPDPMFTSGSTVATLNMFEAQAPAITIHPTSGRIHVAYSDVGAMETIHAFSDDGSAWTPTQLFGAHAFAPLGIELVVDGIGDLHAAIRTDPGEVAYNHSGDDGASWDGEESVAMGAQHGVGLAVSPVTGRKFVAYSTADPELRVAYKDTGAWMTNTLVAPPMMAGLMQFGSPRLAADASGVIHLVFRQWDLASPPFASDTHQVSSHDEGATWSTIRTLTSRVPLPMFPGPGEGGTDAVAGAGGEIHIAHVDFPSDGENAAARHRRKQPDITIPSSSTFPMTIIDDGSTGATDSFTIDYNFPIGELDIWLDIDHPERSELRVVLTHSNGMSMVTTRLLDGTGNGGLRGPIEIDDAAPSAPSGPGTLADFGGRLLRGDWTLQVIDTVSAGNNAGTLEGWALKVR